MIAQRVDKLLRLPASPRPRIFGKVRAVRGTCIVATLPGCSIGNLCKIQRKSDKPLLARAVSFEDNEVHLAPLDSIEQIAPDSRVELVADSVSIGVGPQLLGRTVNALGQPLDGDPLFCCEQRGILSAPPKSAQRKKIDRPFLSSISAVDGLLTLGEGQRIGILAPAGIGKSTLLGQAIKAAAVDVAVVALVGERGREVTEFIEEHLTGEAKLRTVLVVTTSDEPSMLRQLAPYAATTIAEYFRDQGKHVLLVVDSLTRTARAIRETGLAAGELPVRHGYPNSLYSELPKLLERPGATHNGTITALYTVLTNSETDSDPLADEVKSLLDGHITLSSQIASEGIYPAIDFARSVSRIATRVQSEQHRIAAQEVLGAVNRLRRDRELILLGGEPDAELLQILKNEKKLMQFLTKVCASSSLDSIAKELGLIASSISGNL